MSTNTPHSAAPFLMKNVSYDPAKDFTALSRVGSFTQMLVVHPSIPAKSVQELIAYAKANPGKLSFASGNASSVVAGETLKPWAGIDLLHVPYQSAPPAVQDLLGGRVSMLFTDFATGCPRTSMAAARAGDHAAQAQRAGAGTPDARRGRREGFRHGFLGRTVRSGQHAAGHRRPAQHRAAQDHRRPEVKAKIAATGFEAFSSSTEELDDFVKEQLVKWTRMIKEAGIQPE